MAKWPIVTAREVALGGGVVGFIHPMGAFDTLGLEDPFQLRVRRLYLLTSLYVRVAMNSYNGATTITSRINGGDGNLSVSFPAAGTGVFEDQIGVDSLASGDLLATEFDATASSGGAITYGAFSYLLEDQTGQESLVAATEGALTFGGDTFEIPAAGRLQSTVANPGREYRLRTRSAMSNLRVFTLTNFSGASTLSIRRNGADGNQSVSIPADTSGAFEDITNIDVFQPGDTWNYRMVQGADDFLQLDSVSVKVDSIHRPTICSDPTNPTIAFGVTEFLQIEGDTTGNTTEADTQVRARTPIRARLYFVDIPTNSLDGATTFALRRNGASTSLTVSVPAGTTGNFEDTEHAVDVVATDNINHLMDTAASSAGSIAVHYVGFMAEQPELPRPEGHQPSSADWAQFQLVETLAY